MAISLSGASISTRGLSDTGEHRPARLGSSGSSLFVLAPIVTVESVRTLVDGV
jgi:hypothetical protein